MQELRAELIELSRVHDVALDLIGRSHDVEDLLDHVLDEYEARFLDLPSEAFCQEESQLSRETYRKLRSLVLFASQAAALKEKAAAATELRRRAEALEEAKRQVEAALAESQRMREQLDNLLETLDSGILILDAGGVVQTANRAASRLVKDLGDNPRGRQADAALAQVPRGSDGEVRVRGEDGSARVLLVARRDLDRQSSSEVVLVSDITERARRLEEQHRIEKLSEVLQTLSVLSHKINNPLTALLGRAQMLKLVKEGDTASAKGLAVIEESAQRIADLIRELAQVVKDGRQEAVDRILEMKERVTVEARIKAPSEKA
jgi:nitrogen fixation/metabolism regulation signal transduction histidine kinase